MITRGVLLALGNSARLYSKGDLVEIDGKDLMAHANPYFISPAFVRIMMLFSDDPCLP